MLWYVNKTKFGPNCLVYLKLRTLIFNFHNSLLDFRIGIVAGIALHIGMLIYNQNSPDIAVEEVDTYSVKVTLEHGIAFPVCEVGSKIIFKTDCI